MSRRGIRMVIAVAMVVVGSLLSALAGISPAGVTSTTVATPGTVRFAGAAPLPVTLSDRLALTPPMGWNGYNRFHLNVTEAVVQAAARTLVMSGMKAAGYTYVNLDGGWDLLQRDASGNLQPDPAKFPDGIKPVADYVHSLGLKFGIYISAGTENCAYTSAGSYGHYKQDAATFAAWGVDYLKLDWCFVPYSNYPKVPHRQLSELLATQMADALAATGRPIVYDVNDWTNDEPWMWAKRMSHVWRTTHDIQDSYPSMLRNFTHNVSHYKQAGPGGWNDPDMLEVGNGGMSTLEYQSQFSLWAEMAAPLIAGNDLTAMSPVSRGILINLALIAVDQDPLGRQGYPVASAGGLWVLTKPLSNGDRSVVLFNQTDKPAVISTTVPQVGLTGAAQYTLFDLWRGTSAETIGAITAVVPAHGVVVYRVAESVSPSLAA